MKIEILADDFTGANDIGIQLRKYGLKVTSLLNIDSHVDSDVTIISSETRNKDEAEASRLVSNLFNKIKSNGFDKFYKKIDSTLRGPVKAELDAILSLLSDDDKIAVVLGFPKTGRKIINGKHYINETPLHDTAFKDDPIYPISDNNMQKYFEGKIITLDKIRGDLSNIIKNSKEKVLIFDTENDSDLNLIAKALVENNLDKYVVGSSGIMEYLMMQWGYLKERVLIVAGSCNAQNIEQVEELLSECGNALDLIELYPGEKSSKGEVTAKKDILIRSIRELEEMNKTLEKYSYNEIGDYIAGEVIKIVKKYDIKNLIICGGETSLKVLKRLNIEYLDIVREIDTGISLGKYSDYRVITKPGGFGQKKFYKIAYEELKNADTLK